MNTRSFLRGAAGALIAAGIGLGSALATPSTAAADDDDLFGAIVIDNAGNWWYAAAQPSAEEADEAARSACGNRKGCDVVIAWKNGCAAVARKGEDFDSEVAGTAEEAEHRAVDKADGPDIFKNAQVVVSACNDGEPRVVSYEEFLPPPPEPEHPEGENPPPSPPPAMA